MTLGIDGTYAYVYGGQKGLGVGIAVIEGESFRARDSGGWSSVGRISKSTAEPGSFDLAGTHHIPKGTWSVGGSSPRDMPTSQDFVGRLPGWFSNGDPFPFANPSGPVTAMAYPIDMSNLDNMSDHVLKLLGRP